MCICTLLMFHCMLRPDEVRHVCWRSLRPLEGLTDRYSAVFGIINICKPKTRRMQQHAKSQHVLIRCPGLAAFLAWTSSCIPDELLDSFIWISTEADFIRRWDRICRALGLALLHFTPGCCRGGGATEFYLETENVPLLRRRGRWSSEKTLERYVQEGVYCMRIAMQAQCQPRIAELAKLAVSILSADPTSQPPSIRLSH